MVDETSGKPPLSEKAVAIREKFLEAKRRFLVLKKDELVKAVEELELNENVELLLEVQKLDKNFNRNCGYALDQFKTRLNGLVLRLEFLRKAHIRHVKERALSLRNRMLHARCEKIENLRRRHAEMNTIPEPLKSHELVPGKRRKQSVDKKSKKGGQGKEGSQRDQDEQADNDKTLGEDEGDVGRLMRHKRVGLTVAQEANSSTSHKQRKEGSTRSRKRAKVVEGPVVILRLSEDEIRRDLKQLNIPKKLIAGLTS